MKSIQTSLKKYRKLGSLRTRKKLRFPRLKKRLKKLWEDLTLADLYEMYGSTSDKALRQEIEQRILEMATGDDDLLYIIENEEDPLRRKAWKKLHERIQKGRIRKTISRQILIDIIERVPELRIEAWRLLRTLNPLDKELQKILDFDFMKENLPLTKEVEKHIRKKLKDKDINKIIAQIQEITEKLKELKKEQS